MRLQFLKISSNFDEFPGKMEKDGEGVEILQKGKMGREKVEK